MRKLIIAALLVLSSAASAQILPAPAGASDNNSFNGLLINESGLAVSNNYSLDLAKYDASKVSAQVLYSTVTQSNSYFTDGTASTGNLTVISFAGLSSATATNQVTVVNNNLNGAALTVNGVVLAENSQWNKGATTALSAAALAAAIQANIPSVSASATGSVIYATATYGSAFNAYAFSSNTSSITVAKPTMTGGQDNAVLTINGVAIKANTDFSAVTSNNQTATNIATAIKAKVPTLNAGATGAVVYATSTLDGSAFNYTWSSSSPTALSVTGTALTNGTNQGFALNSKVFISTNVTNFSLGEPLLFAIGASTPIGGPTNNGGLAAATTYYAMPLSSYQFQLAKYSTSAVAGSPASDFVTITNTNTLTALNTFALTPVPWSGSATFAWQASNDNTNWAAVSSTGTVTITNTSPSTPQNVLLDFGVFNFRYLRLSYTKPTFGALSLVVPVNIKQDGIGRSR